MENPILRWFLVAVSIASAVGLAGDRVASRTELVGEQGGSIQGDNTFPIQSESTFLDILASGYLPEGSRAVVDLGCGTGLLEFTLDNPSIGESDLLARARALQAKHAPHELIVGPYVTMTACVTPRCSGTVNPMYLPWERLLSPPYSAPDRTRG